MEGKKVGETSIVMVQRMSPQDVNIAGNVHGGVIMKLIDEAAGAVATRHARGNAVTAALDRLDFHHPVFAGDIVTLKASMNLAGRTSMPENRVGRTSIRGSTSDAGSMSASIAGRSSRSGKRLRVRLPCVSVSTARSLLPRSRHVAISNHAVCVLPTPPLRLRIVRDRAAWRRCTAGS